MWRKAQELGLRQSYLNAEGTHKFIKKVGLLKALYFDWIEKN